MLRDDPDRSRFQRCNPALRFAREAELARRNTGGSVVG